MIDTLKLTRRLEGAGMPRRQAEELAEGIADGLKEPLSEQFDRIDQRFERIDQRFDRLEQRFIKLEGDVAELRSTTRVQGALLALVIAIQLGMFWQLFTLKDGQAQLMARLAAIEARLPATR